MRKFAIFFTFILTLLATMSAAAQDRQVALTLERSACFGSCPIYTVTIYTDGTVEYNGERFVDVEGEQTGEIDPATVEQLVAGFEAAGYFDWEDEYTDMQVTDMPTFITSVTRDGETKQITHYGGDENAPLLLSYLENWIDFAANTAQWTGVSEQLVYSPNSPVITLERGACFGMCPIYNLSIYEDGTVVYLGINNVAVTGVQTSSITTDDLDWLVQEMELSGYFDWNDEYTEMFVTDQPTVITSISTDENFKRITRYDGDPNAPVGLVRFEDRIDRVVNSAQWVTGDTTDTE
jgi:hypothetical protein